MMRMHHLGKQVCHSLSSCVTLKEDARLMMQDAPSRRGCANLEARCAIMEEDVPLGSWIRHLGSKVRHFWSICATLIQVEPL